MVLLVVTAVALALAFVLGGRFSRLAEVNLRAVWLFYVAIGLQIAAFPSGVLPWRMGDGAATVLWLVSFGCLCAAATLNYRLRGAAVVGVGMLSNLAAVIANGGHMPAPPAALQAAGIHSQQHNNSVATSDPNLGLLVDRWAAPDWVPLANVFSIGDVVIALGAFVLVFGAMKVPVPSLRRAGLARVRF